MSEEIKTSPTELSFSTYRKGLKPEIEKAKTDMKVAQTGYKDSVRSRQFKRCLFKKAKAALAEYEGLLNGVVTAAFQDATEIDASIKSYVAKTAEVKTAFGAVVDSLRVAKKALYDVETTAGSLAELVENSEQSEENKWLKANISGFGDTVKKIAGDVKTKQQGLADQTNDLADDAFEVAVKAVGISASVNMESLPPLSTKVLSDLAAMKTDVEGNIAYAVGEKQKAQVELNKQNQSQSSNRANVSRTRLQFAGLKNVQAFTNSPNCLEGSALAAATRKKLEELAKNVEQSFA